MYVCVCACVFIYHSAWSIYAGLSIKSWGRSGVFKSHTRIGWTEITEWQPFSFKATLCPPIRVSATLTLQPINSLRKENAMDPQLLGELIWMDTARFPWTLSLIGFSPHRGDTRTPVFRVTSASLFVECTHAHQSEIKRLPWKIRYAGKMASHPDNLTRLVCSVSYII